MKRKLLSIILAAVMLFSPLCIGNVVSGATVMYSDVTEDMWAYGDIMYVTEKGLMNGTGGTTFSPTVSLTATMLSEKTILNMILQKTRSL